MKIAREIADELTPMLPQHEIFEPRRKLIEERREYVEEIIAAKLAPVRDALAQYADRKNWGYYDGSGCQKGEGDYTDACFIGPDVAESAIALLSDED